MTSTGTGTRDSCDGASDRNVSATLGSNVFGAFSTNTVSRASRDYWRASQEAIAETLPPGVDACRTRARRSAARGATVAGHRTAYAIRA